MVSGYAYPHRCEKPLAFFRAFFDDSASEVGDRRLFFAGYLNRAELWAAFADAWKEELQATPSIEYLKMAEAQNLRDQFRGWLPTTRDEKLRGLARVVRHFQPMSFHASLDREFFYRVVEPVSPRGLATPYVSCCQAAYSAVVRVLADAKVKGQVEFIFDEQDGVDDTITRFFDQMKEALPKEARELIAGPLCLGTTNYFPLCKPQTCSLGTYVENTKWDRMRDCQWLTCCVAVSISFPT